MEQQNCLKEMESENPLLGGTQPVRSEGLGPELQGNSEKSQPMRKRFSCGKMVNISISRSRMERSSCLDEIRFSENPPCNVITPKEAKSSETTFE